MLIDSHCHLDRLDLSRHNGELANALTAAKNNGIGYMLCVSIDLETFPNILKIAEEYSDISVSVGLHPTEVLSEEPSVELLVELANHPKVIALGETGLDYYHQDTSHELQQLRFQNHIEAAKKIKKPVIVHTRQAKEDTLSILKKHHAQECGGVFHCFTEDWEMAKKGLDLGFYISLSGIVTFKNAIQLKEVAQKVPLDRLLVETDSPYLAPVPYRGKPNEPAYVRYVAEHIAELRGISFEEVAEKTTENFFNLFNTIDV
jgi:TatD DNase family protein